MQKPAYEMRISDWSSDVCSSDLRAGRGDRQAAVRPRIEFRAPLWQRQRRNRHGNLLRLGGTVAAVRIAAAVPSTLPRPPPGGRGIVEPAPHADAPDVATEIGRAACRERGCPYVETSAESVTLNKKNPQHNNITT